MAPQTVTYQVFLAACQGRSFPDPHCSCRPAFLALISRLLFFSAFLSPLAAQGFPCLSQMGSRGVACKLGVVTATAGSSKAQVLVQTHVYEAAGLGVATKDVPSGAPRLYPSCCPGQRGAVTVLPPLLSLLNIPTAKAVDLEAISFLSASSPFLPASPDPVVSLLLRVHENLGLGADEPQVPDN